MYKIAYQFHIFKCSSNNKSHFCSQFRRSNIEKERSQSPTEWKIIELACFSSILIVILCGHGVTQEKEQENRLQMNHGKEVLSMGRKLCSNCYKRVGRIRIYCHRAYEIRNDIAFDTILSHSVCHVCVVYCVITPKCTK